MLALSLAGPASAHREGSHDTPGKVTAPMTTPRSPLALRGLAPLTLGLLLATSFAYGTGGCSSDDGGAAPACSSNSDCPAPTSVCDTVKGHCVECLELSDCGFRPGTVCSAGACVCPGMLSECDGACVDTKNDLQHCGACGKACGDPANATAGCAMGACGIGACNDGFGDCDKDATNGCEVTLATDAKHCGTCDNACGATSQCKTGACEVCALKLLAKVDYPVGSDPTSVTTGDFNGDGKLDLAAASGGTVSVFLGTGDGTFGAKVDYTVGSSPRSVTTGDLNGDGKLDLAAASGGSVSVLLGKGDGTFQAKVDYPVGQNPLSTTRSVTTGDLNGDGKLDLACSTYGVDDGVSLVSVLLGKGDGTFGTKVDYTVGDYPNSVTAGDFNGDGKLDLATANFAANTVSVLLGKGDGTFGTKVDYPVGLQPRSVTTGDFNGDKKLDLAAANFVGDSVSVLLGKGDGTFGTKVDYPVGHNLYSVTTGDFNGDGKLDLATANPPGNSVSVLLGKGDGTFDAKVDYPVGSSPRFVTTGDFNGDKKLDLATANAYDNSVSVLLNGACTP